MISVNAEVSENLLPLENCALLGCYAESSGNFLPTFQYKLSVPSSGVKNPQTQTFWILDPLKMGPVGCTETSVSNYNYSLRNISGERLN